MAKVRNETIGFVLKLMRYGGNDKDRKSIRKALTTIGSLLRTRDQAIHHKVACLLAAIDRESARHMLTAWAERQVEEGNVYDAIVTFGNCADIPPLDFCFTAESVMNDGYLRVEFPKEAALRILKELGRRARKNARFWPDFNHAQKAFLTDHSLLTPEECRQAREGTVLRLEA